ncbi:transcriptional regulator [Clostridium botulinum]|nr:transcriptional regulator [Clostridium botulinum]MBN1079236.1 transcriptional regulator [Clostridium botulinum]
MTAKELAAKTVKDITRRRALREEGKKQAENYSFENMKKVKRRIG